MANENQNLTNPNNLVDIRLLDYFEGKIGDKYATKAALQTKSNINHTHDTRYYQKSETDELLSGKAAANHNHDTVYSKLNHNHSQYAEHYEVMAEQTRAMTKEAQLQGQIIRPVNMDTLTPSSTFTANQCVAINGVFYRAIRNTASFPVTLVVDGTTGKFVYNESASGHKAYVIGDPTLDEDWEVWSDSSIDFWREYFQEQLDAEADARADDIEEVKGLIDDEADARDADVEALLEIIGYDTSDLVDLGLPSGTLWAKCNIGADSETGYGNYYMYGKGDRQYNSSDDPYTGSEEPLDPSKDTATVVLGTPWHIPTEAQFEELLNNTTLTWETDFNGSGINGCKFTSRTDNTKYIFIPAAGYKTDTGSVHENGTGFVVLSSTQLSEYNVNCLWHSMQITMMGPTSRTYGCSVRPVCDTAPLNKISDKADKRDVYTKAEVDALIQDVLSRIS